jgi:Coenzyme PQQ synthesis protein D (PqqD)
MELRSDLVLQKVGEEALVLDIKTDQIHQFNTTAAWILERINSFETTESLARQFAESFSIDSDTALYDINCLIGKLSQLELLHRAD